MLDMTISKTKDLTPEARKKYEKQARRVAANPGRREEQKRT